MPKDRFTDSKKSYQNSEILKPRQIGGVKQLSSTRAEQLPFEYEYALMHRCYDAVR